MTIRAEVSRLRKAIGGILLARPYRLAPEVEVVLPDLATSPFVAGLDGAGGAGARRR